MSDYGEYRDKAGGNSGGKHSKNSNGKHSKPPPGGTRVWTADRPAAWFPPPYRSRWSLS